MNTNWLGAGEVIKKIRSSVVPLGLSVLPTLALAQNAPQAPFTTMSAFQSFICTVIVGWMFTFFIVLAVVLLLVGAYYILTSGGDPKRESTGRSAILYFVIAIVVALFARGFPLIIGSLFSGGTGGTSC